MNAGDPVAARRARIARVVALAKRVGYASLSVAIAAFAIGVVADFPDWTVALSAAGLLAATVILPVPIVLGYGLRAAVRHERGEHRRRG